MELFDDVVDVPKQPKIRESFVGLFTKRETLYLSIFLGLSLLSTRLPLGLIFNTFVFGVILFIGFIFTFHRFKGRNFDRWFFDFLLFKLKTWNCNKLVLAKDYKFTLPQKPSKQNRVWWEQLLCTIPFFGGLFEKYFSQKAEPLQPEEETEDEVFSTFEADFELDEIEEQIKGILNVHFFYEWQEEVKRDKSLEYADASRLLLTLESFIEKSFKQKELRG
ncbi:hypothetical protein CTH_10042 (plasmid) [Carboxydocella thermautotrophica]|nr:hypothetical protein CTH_10042 [Carboxydocella thermautotrophica]